MQVSIRKLWMDTVQFSNGKRAIFPKIKEIKRLHGGVDVYAASCSRTVQWTTSGFPKSEGQGWSESPGKRAD
jgi:hypothetical protein